MSWRWISIAALLAALVLGYGAFMQRGDEPSARDQLPPRPGYYLRDAVVTETQQDGSLAIRLTASRIEQQPQDGSISMQSVRANYFRAADREWILTARSGMVPPDSRIVYLQGDVQLRPADMTDASWLRTDALALDAATNIAYSTNSPVQMRFGPHQMTVKRFVADLNSEKIRVESADGRFDPQ
jgi:LPS export ABC transporter protein LptC